MTTHDTAQTPDQHAAPDHDVKHTPLDIPGLLERFKLPGFDLDSFLESRKLDIDTLTRGSSAAFAGAQTIVEKQAELLKAALTEVGDALRKVPPQAAKSAELVHRQQELVSEALSIALASMKEIADTVGKSQSAIIEMVTDRVHRNVQEIRHLANRQPGNDNHIE